MLLRVLSVLGGGALSLCLVSLIVHPQIEACAKEVDLVLANLIAQ
jgi:hypothetical protein